MSDRRVSECVVCTWPAPIQARELCQVCYRHAVRKGTLLDHPRRTWPNAELLTEAEWLADAGCVPGEIARRLGVQWSSIVRARRRAVQRAALRAA